MDTDQLSQMVTWLDEEHMSARYSSCTMSVARNALQAATRWRRWQRQ